MATESASTSETEQFWRKVLIEGHRPLRVMHTLFRYLPSPPRCKVCHNPFGGIGGKVVGLLGFKPSRKNPNVCTACCESLPRGGAEVDIAFSLPTCVGPQHWVSISSRLRSRRC